MTFTGIKKGFIFDAEFPMEIPMPTNITSNEKIPATNNIKISSANKQFIIACAGDHYPTKITIYNMSGQMVKQGALSGRPTETVTMSELREGICH